jgi:hypothetical protein
MIGELDDGQIESVLRSEVIGRIGCHDAGRPYVVPITYAYDGHAVYGHSTEGQKLHMMRANPFVCFEVEQVDDLANWRSVVAFGEFTELGGSEAQAARQLLINRFAALVTSETAHPNTEASDSPPHGHGATGQSAVLYRIELQEKTGRFEKR